MVGARENFWKMRVREARKMHFPGEKPTHAASGHYLRKVHSTTEHFCQHLTRSLLVNSLLWVDDRGPSKSSSSSLHSSYSSHVSTAFSFIGRAISCVVSIVENVVLRAGLEAFAIASELVEKEVKSS